MAERSYKALWWTIGILVAVVLGLVILLGVGVYQTTIKPATTWADGLKLLGQSIDSATGFVEWFKAMFTQTAGPT